MTAFVTAAQVRDYMVIQTSTGRYSDANIGSNIRAASAFLERTTGRQFEAQTATKTFTTHGRAQVAIPDLRSVTSITLQDVALTADETYWLIGDVHHSGVFVAVQLRNFRTWDYRSNPEWFDRNLDRDWRYGYTSLPNDLVITGDWGHDPLPEDLLHATKILAGWYTKRPDSVLANIAISPDGIALQYGDLPPEVTGFIADWKISEEIVAV